MNWRAIGCGALAAAAFVLLGVVAIFRAGAPGECPGLLPYEAGTYEPIGTPMTEPRMDGVSDELEATGEVRFGAAAWMVHLQPGTEPRASGEILPRRIVLDCQDGTYRTFQRGGE